MLAHVLVFLQVEADDFHAVWVRALADKGHLSDEHHVVSGDFDLLVRLPEVRFGFSDPLDQGDFRHPWVFPRIRCRISRSMYSGVTRVFLAPRRSGGYFCATGARPNGEA